MQWSVSPAHIANALRRRYGRSGPLLLGVEGFMGSGKTTLAEALARQLSATHIRTDNFVFLKGDVAAYSSRIRKADLSVALRRVLGQGRIAVADGICLRSVLGPWQHEVAKFIYVKRMGRSGTWHEQFHLEDFTSGSIPEYLRTEVTLSDFRYHERYRPHRRADLEVSWVEPSIRSPNTSLERTREG